MKRERNGKSISHALRHWAVVCAMLMWTGAALGIGGCGRLGGAVVIEDGPAQTTEAPAETPVPETETAQQTVQAQPAGDTAQPVTAAEAERIYVHVCGQVLYPGVYELPGDSRITDAVEAAGGFLPEAAAEAVNLAARVSDGSKVTIPSRQEMEDDPYGETASGWYEGESPSDAETKAAAGDGVSASLININQADAGQLTAIPGIGQTRAEAIVAYRTQNGPFQTIEDIMNVTGIKDGLFAKIRDYITVGG